ncbi:unnamed protein product [Ceutorhynchus assimilis]|uniref:Fork-head domain-containing protein n=1 Tax=Ceutorhynchus assimilis TaxID=467358 RepID=A0A9N9QSU9_9CUCU|nr:unnamed protein product [Ceutorhynchus assimilis]
MNGLYSGYSPLAKMNLNIMEPLAEVDGFEPQTRARSNTWPLPRPENFVDPEDSGAQNCPNGANGGGGMNCEGGNKCPVPNSIRHNLSLHNRFMRVQNEGTGKSSWWMINPDAKPGKSPRRRAVSMETSKFEKRRGRVKKKVEMMRNGTLPDQPPSPSSSISESLDLFPESPTIHSGGGFQLSPDFRPRTSSQSSARLSPIPSVGIESEWGFSGTNFSNSDMMNGTTGGSNNGNYSPDQLAGNLELRMKLEPGQYMGHQYMETRLPPRPPSSSPPLTPQSQGTPSSMSTMMGQYIGALNVSEDLNIHVDSLPGGFDCNVEDIIQQELNAEGCLDFNFSGQQQAMVQQAAEASIASSHQTAPPPTYSQTVVTSPSWVH